MAQEVEVVQGVPATPLKQKRFVLGHDFRTQSELQVMIWPAIISIIVFSFIPLFGLLMAFKNYDPTTGIPGIFTSEWNKFQNFLWVFHNYQFWPMIRNTLGINLVGFVVGFPVTIIFALMLNEIINSKFKSLIQTITYLPHFLSWVIYGGLIISLLDPNSGVVNALLLHLHLIKKPIEFLGNPKYFWGIAVITGLLKDIGWGAILYLAAIAGVDQTLYEAAAIDGAGRFKRIWYVTIPGILPTVMIMMIFAVSGMLNNNFNQIYVLQNALNMPTSQVIDTYVYQIGLQQFQFAAATAIGLMKSVIALILLVGANFASKKLTDSGLF
ncbi:ABC transporter permease subunit [Alicyclobacillus fastidiosus]|uniref:ABC transporter permease subunit n=1 Tax=Alicyclobacillus fastidiosus TaxID=392011 RepID=A0ABY6ZAY6_9BACL|nr:ABC transporter permease subunit [Alicyclobacillus fastidiosus]WAH40050.1 ABC transporter permease subunit [Alicyclobacillus fastidiosus]GMA61356.1 sugar ABC transporter permease [Alicyclobacillus fastidiosus]